MGFFDFVRGFLAERKNGFRKYRDKHCCLINAKKAGKGRIFKQEYRWRKGAGEDLLLEVKAS